jgi:Tol biopolymer transport system component
VDRRADVWAFGVVLFELLTGRPLFAGNTITDLIAAVVTTEPEWSRLPPDTPTAVRRLLRRCLQRDPRLRLPDVGSARLELAELLAGVAEPEPGVTLTSPHGYRTPARRTALVVAWSLAVLAVGIATGAFVALRQFRGERVEQSLRRVSLPTPPGLQVSPFAPPLISPDGRHVVIASQPTDRPSMLWIRHLDSLAFEPLAGTEGTNRALFWSPDSRSVAFVVKGQLKRASVGGGVQSLCTLDSRFLPGGTWSPQGVIVMAKGAKGQDTPGAATLVTLSPTTGRVEALTTLDTARGETAHYWPQFLPDGRHIAVEIASTNPQHQGVFITALDAPQERRPLLPERTTPEFANGHVLFVRSNVLFSQPFDAVKLQVGGEPLAIAQNVDFWSEASVGMFSTSDDGAVVYSPARARDSQIAWVARNGATLSVIGRAQPYRQLTLSPDQKRAAVEMIGADGKSEIWLLELARGTTTRVTIDPANDVDPVWSPDGTALIFASDRTHRFALFRKSLTNNQPEASLSATTQDVLTGCRIGACGAESFTPDGKAIVYYKREGTALDALAVGFVWRLDGSAPPQAILQTGYGIDELQVSPDGRLLAYISAESGQFEVYLQPFARLGEKVRVSTTGGGAPKWRADGKELFYVAPNRKLMSVRILPGSDISVSLPEPLFDLSDFQPDQDEYAPSLDAQRFLVKLPVEPLATQTPLQLIFNWNRARTVEAHQ